MTGKKAVVISKRRAIASNLPPRKVVITASANDETANEYQEKKSSLFTHVLIKTLQKPKDFNNDGHITIKEIYNNINTEVSKYAMSIGEQHPQMLGNIDDISIIR